MTYKVQSIKENGPSFEIVSFDPATNMGRLKGKYGVEFNEELSVARLKKLGYKVVKVEDSQDGT